MTGHQPPAPQSRPPAGWAFVADDLGNLSLTADGSRTAGCTGDCDAGTRDCTCGRAVIGMWDDERANPWRAALLYGAVITTALLASHCAAMGGAA